MGFATSAWHVLRLGLQGHSADVLCPVQVRCRSIVQVGLRQLWYLGGLDTEAGIDLDAVLSLMQHKGPDALSDYEMGVLRSVLTGGVRPQSRLFKAGLVESATCPLCQAAEGTLGHLFWECPCTATLRQELPLAVARGVQNGTFAIRTYYE